MKLASVAAKGSAWNVIMAFSNQATTFLVFLVLARIMTPEEIGVVAIANAILSVLWFLVEQGYSEAIVRSPTLSPRLLSTAFWLIAGSGVVVVATLVLLAPAVSNLYDSSVLTPVLQSLACIMGLASLSSIPSALLNRDLKFRAQAIRQVIATLLGGVAGVIMAYQGFGVWSLVGKQAVESVCGLVMVWALVSWRPRFEFSRQAARELFGFGSRRTGTNLIQRATRRADEFLVGFFLGSAALGLFSVGVRAVLLLTEISTAAAQRTAMPLLAKIQDDRAKLRHACIQGIDLSSAVLTPLYAGLAVTAPEVIETFFGSKWLDSVTIVQGLGVASLTNTVGMFVSPLLVATGKAHWLLRLVTLRAVTGVVATVIGAKFGLVGLAYSLVARALILFPLNFFFLNSIAALPAREILPVAVRPWMAAAVMAGAVYAAASVSNVQAWDAPARLLLLVCVGTVAYCGSLFVLAPATCRRLYAFAGSAVRRTRG